MLIAHRNERKIGPSFQGLLKEQRLDRAGMSVCSSLAEGNPFCCWTAMHLQMLKDDRANRNEYFLMYPPPFSPGSVLPISIASNNVKIPVVTVAPLTWGRLTFLEFFLIGRK